MVSNKMAGPLFQLRFCAVPTLLRPVVQAQAQSQAASASLLGQATGRVALTDDWATAWRRHIYTEGLRAIPVGAPTSSNLVTFGPTCCTTVRLKNWACSGPWVGSQNP